jgi:hypothetical protein
MSSVIIDHLDPCHNVMNGSRMLDKMLAPFY